MMGTVCNAEAEIEKNKRERALRIVKQLGASRLPGAIPAADTTSRRERGVVREIGRERGAVGGSAHCPYPVQGARVAPRDVTRRRRRTARPGKRSDPDRRRHMTQPRRQGIQR